MTKEYILTSEIIKKSISQTWADAKSEWKISEIYISEEDKTCLCSHFPIREVCIIKNTKNNNLAEVGNCCVKKFIGLNLDKIFDAIKKVKKDIGKSLNLDALCYSKNHSFISERDFNFYKDIYKKRILKEKQVKWKQDINLKILNRIFKK